MKPSSPPSASVADLPDESAPREPVFHGPVAPARFSAHASQIVRGLLDRLPGGRFTRSVGILSGGTALGQAIVIAVSPVLTRLYAPEDFGTLGVYASLLGLLAVAASLRYEFAIPLPEKDEDAAALVVLSLVIIPVTASAVGLAVWVFRANIVRWTNAPALGPYLWLLPVGVALMGVYQVFNYWAVRKGAFGRVARTRLSQAAAAVTTQLALFPFGPLGLLLSHVIGNAAGSSTLAAMAVRQDRRAFGAVDRRAVAFMAARYRRFPQVSTLSGVVNTGGLVLPVLMLAALFGPLVAGQFALVQRVVAWPMRFLGGAIGQVYFSESASALRTSPLALRSLFVRVSKHLALVAVVPMLVLLVAGPWLFPFVFGRDWISAGQFARLLAPMVAVQLVASPLSQTLNVLERQTWQLGWDILRLVLVVGSFVSAAFFDCAPVAAVAVYASAMFVGYVILWALQVAGIAQSIRKFHLLLK